MDFAKRIRGKVNSLRTSIFGFPKIFNWNNQANLKAKRLLFIYLSEPFTMSKSSKIFFSHHAFKQAIQIAEQFYTNGFIVDIFDYRERVICSSEKYDVILSHNPNIEIGHLKKERCMQIYFSTGQRQDIANEKILMRYKEFNRRKQSFLTPRRASSLLNNYIKESDIIIGFGNKSIIQLWENEYSVKCFGVDNYGYEDTEINFNKNNLVSKNKFLFFSGGDMILKGLDLLLEVFEKRNDAELYICAPFASEKKFINIYKHALFKRPNIHSIGFVVPLSKEYYEIINKCAFIIHPSSTEGSSGGVIQGLHSGLIPIISKESGIDLDKYSFILNECTINEINSIIDFVLGKDEIWIKEASEYIRGYALTHFSENAFKKKWDGIIKYIINVIEE